MNFGHIPYYCMCPSRLAPVLKTIFHQCVISYTCSQSYSDGSVLRTGSTRTLPTNFLVGNLSLPAGSQVRNEHFYCRDYLFNRNQI